LDALGEGGKGEGESCGPAEMALSYPPSEPPNAWLRLYVSGTGSYSPQWTITQLHWFRVSR